MNKHDFILWLRNRLFDLPPEELDRVAGFYANAIDERVEDGMTEEAAVHALGEPEALLREIRSTLPEQYQVEPGAAPQPERRPMSSRKWLAVCGVCLILLGIIGGAATLAKIIGYTQRTVMNVVDYTAELLPGSADYGETPVAIEQVEIIQVLSDGGTMHQFLAEEVSWVEVSLPIQNLEVENSEDNFVYVILPEDGSISARLEDGILRVESSTVSQTAANQGEYVYLYLPREMGLTAICDVGEIELNALQLQTVKLECSVGEIWITNTTIGESLSAEVDCGSIHVQWLDSMDTVLHCQTGSIDGFLVGTEDEYTIDANADWGDNSLFSGGSGMRKLTVQTGSGSIQLSFEE